MEEYTSYTTFGQPKTPIIARPDRVETYIDITRDNADRLSCLFWSGIWPALKRTGLGGFLFPPDLLTKFEIKGHQWTFTAFTHFTRIQVFGPTFHFPKKWKSALERKFPPKALRPILFPTWEQIEDADRKGIRPSYLGRLRITNRARQYYVQYAEDLYEALNLLEIELGIKLTPKAVEFALDTVDESKGKALNNWVLLCWSHPKDMFHFREGSRKKQPGPSSNGQNMYSRHRPKARYDRRPSSERPRGGTRQLKSYERSIRDLGTRWTLYRVELPLYTDYLTRFMKRQGIETTIDLLTHMEKLVKAHLAFKVLDLDSLLSDLDLPQRMKRKVKRKVEAQPTTRGRVYLLNDSELFQGLFFSSDEIKKYLQRVSFPEILFVNGHPLWDGVEVHEYGNGLIPCAS